MGSLATFTESEIEQFAQAFERLFYDDDYTGMASYYTDNAWFIAEGINPIQGRYAIESFWKATCEHAKSLGMKRSIHVDEVHAAADISYALCTLTVEVHLPSGETVTRTTKDATIWRQQPDGGWQIEVDISNPNLPIPAN
jgi:uncharacterized protein (TIGR02246 family)